MESSQVKMLLKRRQHAVARASNWIKLLRNAYSLSQPNRNVFQLQIAEGANKNFYAYDGTLILATRRFVNKMQSSLCPQNLNWFQFALADSFIRQVKEELQEEDKIEDFLNRANELLQERTNTFFDYLRASNFDPVINEAFYDMSVSTGALQINEGDDQEPLIFSSMPADKIYYCEGPWGSIDTVFRDFVDLEIANALQMWPGFKLPASCQYYEDPYQLLTLYECSYFDYKSKMYRTCIVEKDSNEVCWEAEEESWLFIVFRWMKLSTEVQGRGPVLDAFPTSATLNQAFQDELLAAEFTAKPIYMGFSDGLFNPYTFQINSNTVIPVNPLASGGQWPIAPLPKSGDVAFGAIVINDLRLQINQLMFNNPLGPIQDAPPLTATEVAIRQNEMVEDAAASFSRLQRELFHPLIKRVLWILKKRGLIKPFQIDGKTIEIKFSTPLSLGKGQLDVNQFMMFHQNLVAIFGPEATQAFYQVNKIPKYFAENMNVKLPLVKSEQEIIQTMEALAEQAQQMMAQEQQQQQPQGVPNGENQIAA